eukprot:g5818.t1
MVYLIRDALAQYQSDEAFFPQALRHSHCCSRTHLNANLHLNGLVQSGWMKRLFHGELDTIGTSSPGYLEEFMAGSSVKKSLRPAAEWIVVNFFPPRTSGAEVGNTPLSHGEYFFARKVKPEHQEKFLLAELDEWRWQNTAYDHLAVLWANPFVEPKSHSQNDVMVVPDISYEIRVYNATGRSRAKLFSLTVARTKLLPWFDGGVSNRAGFIHVIELAPCLWENLVAKNTGGVAVRVSAERVNIGEQVFSFGTNVQLVVAEQGVKRAEEQEGPLSTEAGRGRDERHGLKPAMSMSVNYHTAGTLMSWSEARPSSQKQKMSSKNNGTLPITNPFAQFGHCWKKYDF